MLKKRILIVEDEPIIAADLEDRLTSLGYQVVDTISSGEKALVVTNNQTVDLILMDIQLEGKLNGVETAFLLRETTNVPLIFLTSNSDEATFSRARQARPQAFLSKPFRGRDLVHAIELAIGKRPVAHLPSGRQGTIKKEDSVRVSQDRMFIKVKERLVRLMFKDILYLAADDYYCRIYTESKEYLATKTLKKLCSQLPANSPFFRCHRSYAVNLEQVTAIGEIYVFVGQLKIPLSRSKRSDILALLNKM